MSHDSLLFDQIQSIEAFLWEHPQSCSQDYQKGWIPGGHRHDERPLYDCMEQKKWMHGRKQWSTRAAVMALLVFAAVAAEGGKSDKQGKKERKSDCGEWQWSVCVANEGDCGLGTREGTRTGTDCKQTIKTQRCKIPCNWKKKFGGECKYDFQAWGECDLSTGKKNRTGVLKRALMDATCAPTVTASKPCGKIPKAKLQDAKKQKKEGKKRERGQMD